MSTYHPDNWVVIKINSDTHGVFYKVLGGWSGGYTQGSSWRMNSGIEHVDLIGNSYVFKGFSGSIYSCHTSSYGLKMNNAHVWEQLKDMRGDDVQLMDEDTNWLELFNKGEKDVV